MRDMIVRVLMNLVDRVGGPMTFRIILQPAMATLLALRAGLNDARENQPPYFWTLLTDPSQRVDLISRGWKDVGRVFVLAVIMDIIYQLIVVQWVYPLETLIVAIMLAVVPYLFIRGPVNRLARRWYQRRKSSVAAACKK
jgi:hypothetical protein